MTESACHRFRITIPRTSSGRPIFAIAERLVEVWSRNNQALAALRALEHRADRARAYLGRPGANQQLITAYMQKISEQRSEQLAVLRTGRRDAQQILEALEVLSASATARPGSTVNAAEPTIPSPPSTSKLSPAPLSFPPVLADLAPAAIGPRHRRYA